MQDVFNISKHATLVRRFVPVFCVFPCIIIISLLLTLGAMEILSAARGYVAGDSLWSKAQRDAVYALTLYAQTHEPAYFERYRRALTIPLSDRRARIEMDKPDYGYAEAHAGLLDGGYHPDDIPGLIRLYRCCAGYSYFSRAVAIRKESDAYIARLQGLGDELHVQISSATPSRKRIEATLEQVRAVDAGVKPLEDAFTATLGEAVRWLRSALTWTVSAIVSILVVLGIYLTARIMVRIRRAEEDYRLLANAIAHTADGIMILDTGRRIVAVNQHPDALIR